MQFLYIPRTWLTHGLDINIGVSSSSPDIHQHQESNICQDEQQAEHTAAAISHARQLLLVRTFRIGQLEVAHFNPGRVSSMLRHVCIGRQP
jgi:hypothetical protein